MTDLYDLEDDEIEAHRLAARHRGIIDGIRLLADFLEDRPMLTECMAYRVRDLSVYPLTADRWRTCLVELGTFAKRSTEVQLHGERKLNDYVMLSVVAGHEQVCERVEVGIREVDVEVYPKGVTPTIERRKEPVFEWKCPPSWIDDVDKPVQP